MKKRFVVLIDDSNVESDNQFLDWIKSENVGWWHWLSNSWLISNPRGHLSVRDIRDKIKEIYDCRVLVLEIGEDYDTWSGFGPKSQEQNMFDWINNNWKNS